MQIVNISTYKFVDIQQDEIETTRATLSEHCEKLGLLGTIYLGLEGINMNLSGEREPIDAIIAVFNTHELFAGMMFKESLSDFYPFTRLAVKIRNEIVTMRADGIRPKDKTGKYITPQELKQWYDEGRDFVILDTRNHFEYNLGAFDNSIELNIKNFREFPDAVKQMDPSMKDKTVVTFCTGGIRCEKATPAMMDAGFKDVYQVHGGILKYFEECGGEHYHGNCFVFDDRSLVDPQLNVVAE